MNLVLSSKSDRKWPKMAKTETVEKTAYIWHAGPKETFHSLQNIFPARKL